MGELDEYKLRSKSAIRRIKGWSERFFDSLPLPIYPVGKRLYYRISDIEPTLERIRREQQWASTKKKSHRTGNMISLLRVAGIGEARKLIARNKLTTS